MKFLIYRYNPETDAAPRMQEHVLAEIRPDMMLRDALSINGLACITPLSELRVQTPVAWVK